MHGNKHEGISTNPVGGMYPSQHSGMDFCAYTSRDGIRSIHMI